MALVLLGVVASILLGGGRAPRREAAAGSAPSVIARQVPSLDATGTPQRAAAPTRNVPTAGPPTVVKLAPLLPTAAATALPTLAPTPTTPLTPFPPRPRTLIDHYWLERPIGPSGMQRVDRFYYYGSRGDGTYPVHRGVEFVNPYGTEILAVDDGMIHVAGEDTLQVYGARDGFYGLVVIQQLARTLDGLPLYAVYGHLSDVAVQPGQAVRAGEVIGYVGMSGIAEGPHLHFEVRIGSDDYRDTANPDLWLRPLPGYGTLAGELVSSDGQPVPDVRLVLYRSGNTTPYRAFASYPPGKVGADPAWGENLCTGDVPVGAWTLQVWHQGTVTTREVTIRDGETSWVSVRVR